MQRNWQKRTSGCNILTNSLAEFAALFAIHFDAL